ncbi:hypothetical protein [Chroococcidiopsis sp. CCNUC1]|uniref:hypothetical protein n=1 Tax=Chroococcidiopsis sp. CCNUC1 TaxID=2653189 RepID=UPI0002FD4AC8|nr:hypothetical protein [Chroococcidiopsis sp. CCNUC1]URD52433.1 hypothetical protein M5J74_10655 [Chroococcidiopsis sp. CCNUC1]
MTQKAGSENRTHINSLEGYGKGLIYKGFSHLRAKMESQEWKQQWQATVLSALEQQVRIGKIILFCYASFQVQIAKPVKPEALVGAIANPIGWHWKQVSHCLKSACIIVN